MSATGIGVIEMKFLFLVFVIVALIMAGCAGTTSTDNSMQNDAGSDAVYSPSSPGNIPEGCDPLDPACTQ